MAQLPAKIDKAEEGNSPPLPCKTVLFGEFLQCVQGYLDIESHAGFKSVLIRFVVVAVTGPLAAHTQAEERRRGVFGVFREVLAAHGLGFQTNVLCVSDLGCGLQAQVDHLFVVDQHFGDGVVIHLSGAAEGLGGLLTDSL